MMGGPLERNQQQDSKRCVTVCGGDATDLGNVAVTNIILALDDFPVWTKSTHTPAIPNC